MFIIGGGNAAAALRRIHEDAVSAVQKELAGLRSITDLSARVKELRTQLETLEIERGKKQEEFDRREREVEHKVGLERKRQEMELGLERKKAKLEAQEEALKADKTRFEAQMKFHQERFEKEVTYQRELLEKMMERLPTAELLGTFGKESPRGRR